MSSRSDHFQCRWRASRCLLTAYLAGQVLGLLALGCLAISFWALLLGVFACLGHAAWVLPRDILLRHPAAITGLRRDRDGWQLLSEQDGWQPVQLCRDSLALPFLIVLRWRLPGRRGVRTLCIPRDAMPPDEHRRLRLRLKFSRRRWAVPE